MMVIIVSFTITFSVPSSDSKLVSIGIKIKMLSKKKENLFEGLQRAIKLHQRSQFCFVELVDSSLVE